MDNSYFENVLSRFVKDFACKGEVLAKYKRGLTASEIYKELSVKISIEDIEKIIEDSECQDDIKMVTDKYGKTSFIKG